MRLCFRLPVRLALAATLAASLLACAEKRPASKKKDEAVAVADETQAAPTAQTSTSASAPAPASEDQSRSEELMGVSGSHLAPLKGEVAPDGFTTRVGADSDMSAGSVSTAGPTTALVSKIEHDSDPNPADPSATRHELLMKMLEADDSGMKLAIAAKYFDAFEFQLWSTHGMESNDRRVELATIAMQEFMKDVQEYIRPGQKDVDPFADGKAGLNEAGNREKSLNALASAMHATSALQETMLAKNKDIQPLSIYSMIQEALVARVEIAANRMKIDGLPSYAREVLANKDVAILLLQARYNHFGAIALERIAPINQGDFSYLVSLFWEWKLDLEAKDLEEVTRVARVLKVALRTRDFMLSAGIHPLLDSRIRKLLGEKMSLGKETSARIKRLREMPTGSEMSPKDAVTLELIDLIKDYSGPSARV